MDELANSKRLSTHSSVVRLSKGRGMDFMAEYEQCREDVRKDYMGKLQFYMSHTYHIWLVLLLLYAEIFQLMAENVRQIST